MKKSEAMSCELCGKRLNPNTDEFGDVDGAVVCGKCMGWEGDDPNPEVQSFLEREGDND